MIKVVNSKEMREMDQFTIEEIGIPGIVLMENAGIASANIIKKYLKDPAGAVVHIFCGKGNNGGDGYVIARSLQDAGAIVNVFIIGNETDLKGDALTNFRILEKLEIPFSFIESIEQIESQIDFFPNLIVDALLGTGLDGAVRGFMKTVIDYINQFECPKVAIDVPSGLSADSASVAGAAVAADIAITMALPKICHTLYPAKSFCGDLYIAEIGIPNFIRGDESIKIQVIEESDIELPQRHADAHKYSCGTVGIIAGSPGYSGAAVLCADAALRMGAGLVTLGCSPQLNTVYENKLTEVITKIYRDAPKPFFSSENVKDALELADWADVLAIGPGLGRHPATIAAVIDLLQKIDKPVVIDADALYAISLHPEILEQANPNWILTPHFGEFSRLLPRVSKEKLKNQLLEYARDFAESHKATLLLKGSPSIVAATDGNVYINSTGNSGLASGGTGDVLTGLIAALMAQGLKAEQAAVTANYLHGLTADDLEKVKTRFAFTAGDIIAQLGNTIQEHFFSASH